MSHDDGSSLPWSALEELSGATLHGRYALGRVLGAGGMGAVFEAEDQRLGRPVAIKVMRPVFAGHGEYVKRFLREAQSASKVRHRNVVVVLDYGEADGGLVYSVMEFLVGEDLEQRLRAAPRSRLAWHESSELLIQIASGLRAAHSKGVIHRDIKPANCFITEEDDEPVVKLVDFGIAKLDNALQTQQLTGTAQLLGTPSYIAPELVQTTSPASPRSDVYSLGVVAYRMLTGSLPFTADTAFEVMRRACMDPVPPLRQRAPEVPAGVEALVLRMLAKNPADRPSDMGEVRQLLRAQSGQTQGTHFPDSSALPLGVGDSAPPPRSSMPAPAGGVLVERAVGGNAPGPEAGNVGHFEAAPGQLAPPVVPLGPSPEGSPRTPVYDPSSAPRSGETVPALGESTLQMGSAGASETSRRGRGAVVLGAVAGVLLLGGLAAAFAFFGDRVPDTGEPAPIAAVDDPVTGDDGSRAPAANEASDPASALPGEDAPVSPPSEAPPGEATPKEPPPSELPAGSDVETPADSEPTPSNGPTEPAPESEPSPPAKPPAPRSSKPSGPPSDSALKSRLRKKIKSRCKSTLAARRVTVSFIVTERGGIDFLTATLKDAGGECAKKQVQGTKFRSRGEETPFKIVVE